MALAYGNVSEGRIIDVHRTTAWRWAQKAVERAVQLGAIPLGREVGTHLRDGLNRRWLPKTPTGRDFALLLQRFFALLDQLLFIGLR